MATTRDKKRVHNFAAGPACLPEEVLLEAQKDLLNFQGCGRSVMELSHRGKEYTKIHKETKDDLRSILNIPANYKILFLTGGGAAQFAGVPINLCENKDTAADYIVTGSWSKQAAQEASDHCKVNIAATGEETKFTSIPNADQWKLSENAAYIHYCDNETIHGVAFPNVPSIPGDKGKVPLVCDMSSSFLSRPVDVSKFGIIYSGAQKNAGIAGVTVVIIREDLLEKSKPQIPSIFNYKKKSDADSLDNTPPVFNIYITGLVLKWIKAQGGLSAIEKRNQGKADVIYNVIDNSNGFYTCPVDKSARSVMNIPIRIRNDPKIEEIFVAEAEKADLHELKGHRSVGGLRVSLYNAMTLEGVQDLARFMQNFQRQHANQ